MLRWFLYIGISILFFNCKSVGTGHNPGFYKGNYTIPYALHQPNHTFALVSDLDEISGLSYCDTLDQLLAISDEQPFLYFLDKHSGEVVESIVFGKKDDYEGVTSHGRLAYIVESNGNIKVVDVIDKSKINEYNGPLSSANNIEGIEVDMEAKTLLMAGKGDAFVESDQKGVKSIFKWDLITDTLIAHPAFSLNLRETLKDMRKVGIESNPLIGLSVNARTKRFGPSGIAKDPQSGDLYILSSRGNIMIVCDGQGDLKAIAFLKKSMHAQAEGICFDKDLNLYISNEARGNQALIYKYQRVR